MSRAGMNDEQDRKLESLLRTRRMEPASPDLAQRIVRESRNVARRPAAPGAESLAADWLQLFAELRLPRPAYLLAGTLLVGVAVGWITRFETATPDTAAASYVQSFLYADNGYLDDGSLDEEDR